MVHYWCVDGDETWARTAAQIGVTPTPTPEGVWWEVRGLDGSIHRIVHTTRLHRALIARFGAIEALRRMERDSDDPAYYYRLARLVKE
ncbi:hypothetical protein [Roseiflexus sp.]